MSQTYYFNPCCQGLEPFGLPNNSKPFVSFPGFISTVGAQYLLTISGNNGNIIFSGCVTYSGVTLNTGAILAANTTGGNAAACAAGISVHAYGVEIV